MLDDHLKPGYRQAVTTAITVVLTGSLLFFRFVVFEPHSGPWTIWGRICAVLAGVSILLQLFVLWRALQPSDELVSVYRVTLRWFVLSVLLFVLSLVANPVEEVIY